ncbi:MAG: peptidylprolyl isomerase [Treponema sp.]|jgi:peptidylprolyl isomerase|nr:peptidylprolyl isomerase [Treponema sp.]
MFSFNNASRLRALCAVLVPLFWACTAKPGYAAPGDSELGDGLFARISTPKGDIILRLEYEKVPLTVCNFAALAEGKMSAAAGKPFYDGLTFHRVVPNFMIQGGDPLGNGRGGPGYQFPDEIDASLTHNGPGVLSMANAGPGTNGSQFFITHNAAHWLDGKHSVFGAVVSGQEVVNRIAQGDAITKIRIIRNGAAAKAFAADQAAFDALRASADERALAKKAASRAALIAAITEKYPSATRSPQDIFTVIQKQGTGARPAEGSTVKVRGRGLLLSGRAFDDSRLYPNGLWTFTIGKILPGLDITLREMRVGEKRFAIIPPELAYGSRGLTAENGYLAVDEKGEPRIPPESFLFFELELTGISK